MADQGSIANLKQNIDQNIVQNTTKQISGTKMNTVLNNIVDTLNFNGRDFFNVNEYREKSDEYANAAAGRAAVPDEVKKIGLVITYLLADGWYIDQFIGSNISGWGTASNWKVIGPVDVLQNTLTIGGEDKGELFGQIEDNPEWLWVLLDSEERVILGLRSDGKLFAGAGIEGVTDYLEPIKPILEQIITPNLVVMPLPSNGYATVSIGEIYIFPSMANSKYYKLDWDTIPQTIKLTSTPVSSTYNLVCAQFNDAGGWISGYDIKSTTKVEDITIRRATGAKYLYINCLSSENATLKYDILDLVDSLNVEVKDLNSKKNYDVSNNPIVIPSNLYLRSDKDVVLYKNSIFTDLFGEIEKCDVLIRTIVDGKRKFIELKEPTYLGISSLGDSAKLVVSRQNEINNLIYKDIAIKKKDVSTLDGRTVKILSFGDSLTEGIDWSNTPICMLADELSAIGVTTTMIGTLARDYTKNGQTIRINYEGHGGWSYRAAVGMRALYMHVPDSYTKHEWVEGVDGTMDQIKANNPFLYEATESDLENYPQWCFHVDTTRNANCLSYADNPNLGTYWIFNPAKYFSERDIDIPDVITIAFGTNEWHLMISEYNNALATSCCKWMVQRFASACPNAKIVVIPMNNLPASLEPEWKLYAMPLCSNVIKEIEALNNNNVVICPIYAQGSRVLGFDNTIGSATDISSINNVKRIQISNNVHMMYVDDDSNDDYAESLAACVINVI